METIRAIFLTRSSPYDLLLARDRGVDIAEPLEVNEAIDLVAGGKLAFDSLLVLKDASFQVAGNAGAGRQSTQEWAHRVLGREGADL